jgi:hypothetical protein
MLRSGTLRRGEAEEGQQNAEIVEVRVYKKSELESLTPYCINGKHVF